MTLLRIFDWEPSDQAIPPRCGEGWEAYAFHFITKDFNAAPLWYLAAAHAYYEQNSSIFRDETFDYLARLLLRHRESLTGPYADLLDEDTLSAGTYMGEYPEDTIALSKKCCAVTNRRRTDPAPYAHRHYEVAEL